MLVPLRATTRVVGAATAPRRVPSQHSRPPRGTTSGTPIRAPVFLQDSETEFSLVRFKPSDNAAAKAMCMIIWYRWWPMILRTRSSMWPLDPPCPDPGHDGPSNQAGPTNIARVGRSARPEARVRPRKFSRFPSFARSRFACYPGAALVGRRTARRRSAAAARAAPFTHASPVRVIPRVAPFRCRAAQDNVRD